MNDKEPDISEAIPEDFTGDDDHVELGDTGLFPKGTSGLVDKDGKRVKLDEKNDDNV